MDLLHQLPCAVHRLRSALPSTSRRLASNCRTCTAAIVPAHMHVARSNSSSAWGDSCAGHFDRQLGRPFGRSRKLFKTGNSSTPGFRVYPRVFASAKRGFSSADRWGRFARHLEARRSSGSWSFPSSLCPVVVLAARSVERRAYNGSAVASSPDGSEGELENSLRRQESAKRQARSSDGPGRRGQQRTPQAEGSSPSKLVVKSKNRFVSVVGKEERTGDSGSSKNSKYLRGSSKAGPSTLVGSSEKPEQELGKSRSILCSFSPASRSEVMKSLQRPNDKQGANERKPKQQTERKPKKKDFPVEAQLRRDLNMCSKEGDVLRALEIYDRSLVEGSVRWNQYNFNILLYLCSSAAIGTLTARKSGTDRPDAERLNLQPGEQSVPADCPLETANEQPDSGNGGASLNDGKTVILLSPEVIELAAKRGFEIYEEMKRQQVPPNEATLTAVARLAVRTEDGELAFQMVKEMTALNLAPKLRSYSPALVIFCKQKAVDKAFEVDAHMLSAGVQPEETELAALLRLCVDLGLEEKVYSLLHRLRTRVRELAPTTVTTIEDWFSGTAGVSAGQKNKQADDDVIRQAMVAGGGGWHGLGFLGKGEWKVQWTNIDKDGICCSCKERLVTIDLDPQETENFAQSLSELAASRESRSNDFRRFQEWLERHGPFGAIVDGANVGLYNQNFSQGGFNFFQLNSVLKTAQEQGLSKKSPLVILHQARTKYGAANSPLGQQLLQKWGSADSLYTTPNGSNDDWYWLYAAVKNKSLLITNDEMRDHLFQLLGTDFFPKWKERHQVRFSATNRGPVFHLPPPYSLVIQESEKGSWHIPRSGGDDIDKPREWLCVTRPGFTIDRAASPSRSPRQGMERGAQKQTSDGMDIGAENLQIDCDAIETSSPDSKGTHASLGRPKRTREPSSSTLRKLRAADRRSDSGPVTFDI